MDYKIVGEEIWAPTDQNVDTSNQMLYSHINIMKHPCEEILHMPVNSVVYLHW